MELRNRYTYVKGVRNVRSVRSVRSLRSVIASHLYEIGTFNEKPSDIKKYFLQFEGYLEALLKSMTTVQKSISLQ